MSRILLQSSRKLAIQQSLGCKFATPVKARFASNMSTSHLATLDTSLKQRLPASAHTLFEAKAQKQLSFEQIAQHIGRNEVAVAALFYGQARANQDDITKLSQLLDVPEATLAQQLAGFPDRGRTLDMPPKEPLIYRVGRIGPDRFHVAAEIPIAASADLSANRLYEIVQNYGYAYKAVMNEKFGDGIMSAISFTTRVEKETDPDGSTWCKITLRGKWLPFSRF